MQTNERTIERKKKKKTSSLSNSNQYAYLKNKIEWKMCSFGMPNLFHAIDYVIRSRKYEHLCERAAVVVMAMVVAAAKKNK